MNQQLKPKNKKIKYPAPYTKSLTQSRNEDENTLTRRKTKMSYSQGTAVRSLPLSHSWMNDRGSKRLKNRPSSPKPVTKLDSPFSNLLIMEDRRMARLRQPTIIARQSTKLTKAYDQNGYQMRARPDPTVPHLKYGLFPRKCSVSNKPQFQELPSSRAVNESQISPDGYMRKEKKNRPNKLSPASVPKMFDSRGLSVSAPAHVDIKPRLTRRGIGF